MNFENWIPIIYEPKTNKKEKEKKRSQMKQLRLNRTKYSRMALLHTTNSKKRRQWRIKTINSSTFPATKWILDLKKETASAKRRRVKKKKKKKQTWIWTKTPRGLQKALLREKRNESKASNASIVAPSLSFSKITLYAYAFE